MKKILFLIFIASIFCQSCIDNTQCKSPTVCQLESQQCYLNATKICNENNKCYDQCPEGTRIDPKLSGDLGFAVCVKLGSFGTSPRCRNDANGKCIPCMECSGFEEDGRPCIPCMLGTGGSSLLECVPTWKGQRCTKPEIQVLDSKGNVIKNVCPPLTDNCCPDLKCKEKSSDGGGKPPATGQCCHSNSACVITTFLDCIGSYNGAYGGDKTSCSGFCGSFISGTCELPGGICSTKQTKEICEQYGGTFTPGALACIEV